MIDLAVEHVAAAWLLLATVLGVAELVVPGVFLVFIAIAAAITGALALLLPGLGLPLELLAFAAWSAVIVTVGRRWYGNTAGPPLDPLLNDRAARLVGEVVIVAQPIEAGRGRVTVGDGAWPAKGPDADVGARVRIVGHDGTSLLVEPIELPLRSVQA